MASLFIEGQDGKPINISLLQTVYIDEEDSTKVILRFINGECTFEKYDSEEEAINRLSTIKDELTSSGGGGGTPKLQTKTISIPSNGDYSVTYDDNYDGLESVGISVNVTGVNGYTVDFSEGIGYSFVPDDKVTAYNYAKNIKANWDSSITNMYNAYQSDTNLVYFPLVDTSNVFQMSRCFRYCSNLEIVPRLNTSNCEYSNYAFEGCTNLKTIPLLDFPKAISFGNVFKNCSSLTDESLNNILAMCPNMTAFMNAQPAKSWTLKAIGISSAQVARCQNLNNWNNFINAGWTSGY